MSRRRVLALLCALACTGATTGIFFSTTVSSVTVSSVTGTSTVSGASTVTAAGPCAAPAWSADYFANETLSGSPAVARCDAAINFDWGSAGPPGIPADHFSVRWTSTQTLGGGSYRFSTVADDGVRVRVDGVTLINDWHNQNATTTNAKVHLTPGQHTIMVEYFEGTGLAVAKLTFVNLVSDDPSLTTPVSSNDFNAATVNTAMWEIYNSAGSATPQANKTSYVTETGGMLKLTTSGLAGSGVCMCTATSKPTTPYGRWDVRAKMSAGNANGGVIMLWPNAENWPVGGELDIAELSTATRQSVDYADHYGADNRQILLTTPLDATAWHTYSIEWTPTRIRYWIDGLLVSTITDPAVIPTGAMHLVAQAGPHNHATANTAASELDIDWIRTYK